MATMSDMVDDGEQHEERGAAVARRGGTPRSAVGAVTPLTLEEALAMRGTGWEGDLDAMRESRVWLGDDV